MDYQVLAGKENLTREQIANLSNRFGISAAIFFNIEGRPMYETNGITFKTGSALISIFRANLLNKSMFEDIPVDFIKLSTRKIDRVLALNRAVYAGKTHGYGKARDPEKIQDIANQIAKTKSEFMPFLLCRNHKAHDLVVEDGRHRLAYLFENGFQYVWCVIPAEQTQIFIQNYT